MRLPTKVWLPGCVFILVAFLCGCGSEESDLSPYKVPEGCNPLAPYADCLLPYPTDYFLVADDSMPSGSRIRLTEQATVYTPADHLPADPTSVHPADGFSPAGPILAVFPAGVDAGNLVFHTGDVFASLLPSSPTVLLDAETGEPVLHFAELDPMAESDDRRALFIRPLVRLENQRRYVVAIHDLEGPGGGPLSAPEGFRRIRDGLTGGDPILGPLAVRYESGIFPLIEDFGISRDSLQLAWDFSTESEENVTGDMLAVREMVMDYFSSHVPEISITQVTDDVDQKIFRRLDGTVEVPLYLEDADPGARLFRDAQGRVAQNGLTQVPFTMLIPRSLAARAPGDPPARVLQYGHGFFGERDSESELGHLEDTLEDDGFVFVAADWWGMSRPDVFLVIDAIASRPSEIADFTDRLHQAMANFIALAYAVQGPLLERPEIQVDDHPLYDPDQLYYYGNSQGHILGGTYLALSPQIDRAVLGVGGASLTLMMPRALPFASFMEFINMYIPDPLDTQKFMVLTQTTFDRIDPITYAPHLLSNTYSKGPSARRLLMHMGLNDTQVPNMATQYHARALGLKLMQPSPTQVPALTEAAYPLDGSGLVEFDLGAAPPPAEARPADEDSGVHSHVRELPAVIQQIDLFLRPEGQIEQTCEGVCDPE
jgi:hypothetical protein